MVTTATPCSFPSVADTCAAPGGDRGWRAGGERFSRIAAAVAAARSVYAGGSGSSPAHTERAEEDRVDQQEKGGQGQRKAPWERPPHRGGAGQQGFAARGSQQ